MLVSELASASVLVLAAASVPRVPGPGESDCVSAVDGRVHGGGRAIPVHGIHQLDLVRPEHALCELRAEPLHRVVVDPRGVPV